MLLTEQPGVHAAHGGSHDQSRVFDAEALGQEAILCLDHVVVAILWELRMQSIAGLAGFPMPQGIGQYDEVARSIQKLTGTKQLAGKLRPDEARARPAR